MPPNVSFPYLLLGNKCDLDVDREITANQATNYANQCDMQFFETSALNGTNIKDAFYKIAEIASAVPTTPVISTEAIRLIKHADDNRNGNDDNKKKTCWGCLDGMI
eukprot:UN10447